MWTSTKAIDTFERGCKDIDTQSNENVLLYFGQFYNYLVGLVRGF